MQFRTLAVLGALAIGAAFKSAYAQPAASDPESAWNVQHSETVVNQTAVEPPAHNAARGSSLVVHRGEVSLSQPDMDATGPGPHGATFEHLNTNLSS
jgi:hypothetical protein